MKQNKIFKIISSLMVLLTILLVVNATTISNSLSTFTNNIDMGTKELYNATNINATNFYANGVLLKPDTNNFPLSIQVTGTTSKTLNLERNGTTNITAGFTDIDTDTWYNVTSVQVTGTGTKTLNVEQLGGIANRTTSWTDIDTDTTINVTSIQVTGTTTKIITLEQLNGITNRTASWTDSDTTYTNGTGLNLTGTTFYLDLNYVDGVYVKRNTWTTIDNYPTGCSAGAYISTIGDTLTCSTPADLNFNVSSIQFTGTTTKTLNLEQIGIANRTATFTDTDTNNFPLSVQFTGTTTKTLNVERNGTTNLTATFTDIDTDTNNYPLSIQTTGTGTKTLNLERSGLANLTASWTDVDTTYSNTTGLTLSGTVFGLDTVYAVGQYMTRSNWTSIDNYPSTCSSGQFVSGIGDTLTCATPSDVKNVTSIQVTGTTTKTVNLEQGGITNRTATFTDLTNSSADMIFAINNTNGIFTMQGLNMSMRNTNMNAQNTTYTQGSGGIILNQSQSHFSIQQNSSGCVVIKGASSTLAVC